MKIENQSKAKTGTIKSISAVKENFDTAGFTQADITIRKTFSHKVLIRKLVRGKSSRRPKQNVLMRAHSKRMKQV